MLSFYYWGSFIFKSLNMKYFRRRYFSIAPISRGSFEQRCRIELTVFERLCNLLND